MHSSRMCTICCSSHLLGMSAQGVSAQRDICQGGVSTWGCLPMGCLPMGYLHRGVCLGVSAQRGVCQEGGVCQGGVFQHTLGQTSPVDRMTDTCENITTTLRTVNMLVSC